MRFSGFEKIVAENVSLVLMILTFSPHLFVENVDGICHICKLVDINVYLLFRANVFTKIGGPGFSGLRWPCSVSDFQC